MVLNESRLPTGSFKARGLGMAVSMAKEFGFKHLAIPTNGNAGSGFDKMFEARIFADGCHVSNRYFKMNVIDLASFP